MGKKTKRRKRIQINSSPRPQWQIEEVKKRILKYENNPQLLISEKDALKMIESAEWKHITHHETLHS